MNLSEVFSETDEAEETTEVEETVDEQPEADEATEEDSTVEDDATTTVAEQDEAKPQESEKKDDWTYAAYQDEKRKRQELEERLKKLEEKPEDDTDYISQAELKERLQKDFDNKLQIALFQDRLARNYEQVSTQHQDFKQMEQVFADMASRDNNLKAQFLSSPNPAEFAYKHAKNYTLLNEHGGDVEKLIQAKIEEAKKEFGLTPKEVEEKPKKSRAPSLANATESEKNSAPVENISSLNEIFADSQL